MHETSPCTRPHHARAAEQPCSAEAEDTIFNSISDYRLHSSKRPTQMSTHTTQMGNLHYGLDFDSENTTILQTLRCSL